MASPPLPDVSTLQEFLQLTSAIASSTLLMWLLEWFRQRQKERREDQKILHADDYTHSRDFRAELREEVRFQMEENRRLRGEIEHLITQLTAQRKAEWEARVELMESRQQRQVMQFQLDELHLRLQKQQGA